MLDLGGADAEGKGAERAVGRGVRVAAHQGYARDGRSDLRPDAVDDALAVRAEPEERHIELAAVPLQGLHLDPAELAACAEARGLRGDIVIHGGEGAVSAAYLPAVLAESLERLRARYLVHEVAVNVEDRELARLLTDDMAVEELLIECLSHIVPQRILFTISSPISEVLSAFTSVLPPMRSPVRQPSARAAATACSIERAAASSLKL